jgi:4'-phosphopantetheinyl transferase
LARYAICKRLGISNRDLDFGANEYGKPVLHEPNGIHFNISHSGNWVVCAVDDTVVGIDVEMIKPIDFKIAERFFSRDEYISFMNQPEEIKLKYFYMIWTLKESYIKAEGKGLSIPLNSFTIRMESNDISVSVNNEIREFYFYQSFLDSDTVYAVCTLYGNTKESIYCNIEGFLTKCKILFYYYKQIHE